MVDNNNINNNNNNTPQNNNNKKNNNTPQNKRTKKIKFIRQGKYGCVYKPGLKTNKKTKHNTQNNNSTKKKQNKKQEKKQISKLLTKKSADKEKEFFKRIDTINSTGKYHIKLDDEISKQSEIASIIHQNNLAELKDGKGAYCSVLMKQEEPLSILTMEDGKQDLDTYLSSINETKPEGLTITESLYFIIQFKNLIYGLTKMRQARLAHLDIKPDNIVFNTDLSKSAFKFIDFGLSLDYRKRSGLLEQIDSKLFMFIYDYIIYPAEVILLIKEVFEAIYQFVISYQHYNSNENDKRPKTEIINWLQNWLTNYEVKKSKPFKYHSVILDILPEYIDILSRLISLNPGRDMSYIRYKFSLNILKGIDTFSLLTILERTMPYLNLHTPMEGETFTVVQLKTLEFVSDKLDNFIERKDDRYFKNISIYQLLREYKQLIKKVEKAGF